MKDGFISILQCIQPYVYNRNIHFWMYNKTKNKRFLNIYIYIYIYIVYIYRLLKKSCNGQTIDHGPYFMDAAIVIL